MSVSGKRVFLLAISLFLIAALISYTFPPHIAAAAPIQLTSRSLTLIDGATDGGSKPSGVVNHKFSFTIPQNSGTIKSIVFKYCTSAGTTADIDQGGACTTPAGLKTDSTNPTILGTQTGFSFDSLNNTTNGAPYVTSAAGLDTSLAATSETIELNSVTNPAGTECSGTFVNCTFYVAILAYDGTAGTGTLLASGTVAASVNQQIKLTGTMPESLIFCTGGTIPSTNSIPDCTQATSGDVSFNQLFSPTSTAYATSQMAASTNANSGYVITVNGATLTNGSYTIAKMGTTDYSKQGTPQFGMNVVKNTGFCGVGCDVGADVTQTGGTLYNGEAHAGYNTGGANCASAGCAQFTFNSGDSVADSLLGNGTPATGASDAQTFTASYVVNVSGSQAAGTYTTTLTYICTATY